MAKFTFRLEPILKLRKLREQQSQRELAQRLNDLLSHQSQMSKLDTQISQHYDHLRHNRLVGRIEVSALMADRRYLNHLHTIQTRERETVAQAQAKVDQARAQLVETKKQTDIMSKLKEHLYHKHLKDVKRQETRELDDLAGVRTAWLAIRSNRTVS